MLQRIQAGQVRDESGEKLPTAEGVTVAPGYYVMGEIDANQSLTEGNPLVFQQVKKRKISKRR